jgi:DNA-binding IclR family transcriptional regulator
MLRRIPAGPIDQIPEEVTVTESPTRGVDRALAIIAIVCEQHPISLSDSSRAVELPVSTTLRLLRAAERAAYVARDPQGLYVPGPRILQFGAIALSGESLIKRCAPGMEELAEETGESVYLAIRGHADNALYLAITEGTHSVRHVNWVGRHVPLAGSAVGAALTGAVPAVGYAAVARGVEEDITAIAAPISAGSEIVAALSLLVPTYRVDAARTKTLGAQLKDVVDKISSGLAPIEKKAPRRKS